MSKAHEDPDRYMSTEIPATSAGIDLVAYIDSQSQYPDEDTPVDIQEAIADAIAVLTEEEWFVLESNLIRKVALRVLAETLGYSKTKVWQVRETAKGKLVRHLMADRSVTDRYGLEPTWNDACRAALMALAPTGGAWDTQRIAEGIISFGWDALKDAATERPESILGCLREIADGAAILLALGGNWSVADMERLLCGKQYDYSTANINAFGMHGIAVRMSDKVARWTNLKDRTAVNEPLVDTLRDMVGYAVVATMLDNGTFELPLIWNEV